MATCHSERKHFAKGYCVQCYKLKWHHEHKPPPKPRPTTYAKTNVTPYPKIRGNKTTIQKKNTRYMRLYGISYDEVNKMYGEQNGLCALCGLHMDKPLVDHCHKTGKVRGLLHSNCNTIIGMANDDISILQLAIQYLANRK